MANIVEAVGTAATTKKGAGRRVEQAMADAVHAVSKECEAIWARADLSLEEKNAQIAAISNPDAIRKRMLAARDAERTKIREEAAAREEAAKATKH